MLVTATTLPWLVARLHVLNLEMVPVPVVVVADYPARVALDLYDELHPAQSPVEL